MRVQVKPPKLEWRTIAVTDADPVDFARSLQAALQILSDGHFNVVMQLTRGAAHVILANRVVAEEFSTEGLPTVPPPPGLRPPPRKHQPFARPLRPSEEHSYTEQYVYHYLSPDGPQAQHCGSMAEALRLSKEHITGDGSFVPGYIVCMVATTFEAPSFPYLIRSFAEEIDALAVTRAD